MNRFYENYLKSLEGEPTPIIHKNILDTYSQEINPAWVEYKKKNGVPENELDELAKEFKEGMLLIKEHRKTLI